MGSRFAAAEVGSHATQAMNPDEAVPGTALEGLVACDRQTFPFFNSFLTILLTLPVSTAGVERSFFHSQKSENLAEIANE